MKAAKNQSTKSIPAQEAMPVHSLGGKGFSVSIEDIGYTNPYDFTREHRHDYFEIFFFEKGGGSQLIDFKEIPVLDDSVYIVYPQQVHLLKKGPKASGSLIQFKEEVISSGRAKSLLQQFSYGVNAAIVFERDKAKRKAIVPLLTLMQQATNDASKYSPEIRTHYLQALLLQLVGEGHEKEKQSIEKDKNFLIEFQELLEKQYRENHLVSKYVSLLNSTEKKLSALTKKHFGKSPLQVIHERLVLEAKRILLFEGASHKEIAYQLGFDSPASFSHFIKNKTGYTPSELYTYLVEIHK